MKLRRGRKVGRTLYIQLGDTPSDSDPLIGVLDTPELAEAVVKFLSSAQQEAPWHDVRTYEETLEAHAVPRPAVGAGQPKNP